MARKKISRLQKHIQNNEDQQTKPNQNNNPNPNSMAEETSEKLSSLKSLNAMLLKETVERRHQVDSLLHSNSDLELELTHLKDQILVFDLEKDLIPLFLETQYEGFWEKIRVEREKEIGGLVREKVEMVKKLERLDREMSDVVRERSEMETLRVSQEVEIVKLKENLSLLDGVRREKDEIRKEFDVLSAEANMLRERIVEVEERERSVGIEFEKLKLEYQELVKEKEGKQGEIRSLVKDKDLLEKKLRDSANMIEGLKRNIVEIADEKKKIEEGKIEETMKASELQQEVEQLSITMDAIRKERGELYVKVAELEKSVAEAVDERIKMSAEIVGLVEKKWEMEQSIVALSGEKELAIKRLDETLKELDSEKREVTKMVEQNNEIGQVKIRQENEIVELRKEVVKLGAVVSSLQEKCNDYVEENNKLQSEVANHEDSLAQVSHERDIAQKGFEEEKENGLSLKSKISQLVKSIDYSQKELGLLRVEHDHLMEKEKEMENCIESLKEEKSSLQNSLSGAQQGISALQSDLEKASSELEQVLSLLKNTVAFFSVDKFERNGKIDAVVDELKVADRIKPYIGDLEAIKSTFKRRETEVEDMKREVDVLRTSVVDAHKGKNFWTLVSSATTIFAAASVAYVAKIR